MFLKLKSAISTVRETLQAVRELPVATKEAVELACLADENARLRDALESMNRLYSERCDAHIAEKKNMWDTATKVTNERNDLRAKLARYEAAETWHQVTAGEGELPPEGVDVVCRLAPESPPYIGKPCPGYETFEWRFLSSKDVPC